MRRALIANIRTPNIMLNGELLYTCTPGDRLSHVVSNTIMDGQCFDTHRSNILRHNSNVFRELCMSTCESDPVIPRPFAAIAIPPANHDKGARYQTDAAIRKFNRLSFEKRHGWYRLLETGVDVADFAASSALARTAAFLNSHEKGVKRTIESSAILVGLSDNTTKMISKRASILKGALEDAENAASKLKDAAIGERNAMKSMLESTLENVNHKFRRIVPGLREEMNMSGRLKYALNDPHYARVKYARGKLSFIDNETFSYLGEIGEKAEKLCKGSAIVGAGIALIDAGIDGIKKHSWKVFGEEGAKDEFAYGVGWFFGDLIVGAASLAGAPAILAVGAGLLVGLGLEETIKEAI